MLGSVTKLYIVSLPEKNEAQWESANGLFDQLFKGNVQRKLKWVENGVNRSVGATCKWNYISKCIFFQTLNIEKNIQ